VGDLHAPSAPDRAEHRLFVVPADPAKLEVVVPAERAGSGRGDPTGPPGPAQAAGDRSWRLSGGSDMNCRQENSTVWLWAGTPTWPRTGWIRAAPQHSLRGMMRHAPKAVLCRVLGRVWRGLLSPRALECHP